MASHLNQNLTKTLTIEVSPEIPAPLARLPELAGNLYFSWDRPTRALFEELDPPLWGQGPRQSKTAVALHWPAGARSRGRSDAVVSRALSRGARQLRCVPRHCGQRCPRARSSWRTSAPSTAFNESFPIYSGGLGVLAGDHCKAASDERLNFVAVGLLYGQGYFTQSRGQRRRAARESIVSHDARDLPVAAGAIAPTARGCP
jgi:starch phosphorylase